MPFLCVSFLAANRECKLLRIMMLKVVLISFTAVLLLLVFQKRPLIIFFLEVTFIWFLIKSMKNKSEKNDSNIESVIIISCIFLYLLLIILYYFNTNIQGNNIFLFMALNGIVLSRIIFRLSLPGIMYVHYFPSIEPHYGISNIGKLANLLQVQTYEDTRVVFEYFSKSSTDYGSVASSVLFDFYGSFGWTGWILGSILLGVFIFYLEKCLMKLKPNIINIIMILYCFVFIYYLSQASFFRALLGYGGILFFIVWLLILYDNKIKLNPSSN
jgi:hypothetical protein